MAVFNPYFLVTEAGKAPDEGSIERKILTSKMKSLTEHLEALIQKKIRLDLEIKRTKKKLTKLKQISQTNVKLKVELEGFDYDSLNPEQVQILREQMTQEVFDSLIQLDEEVLRADDLMETYSDLPLYED